ncbi:hypothetical protein [Anaerotignum sp.]|uniref:hypothetical protein n=1 Tax=Anaerotignum sp. TaxID=2039241 RepID=UPI00332951C9
MKCKYIEMKYGEDFYNVEVKRSTLFPEFLEVVTRSGQRLFINTADIFSIYPDDHNEPLRG